MHFECRDSAPGVVAPPSAHPLDPRLTAKSVSGRSLSSSSLLAPHSAIGIFLKITISRLFTVRSSHSRFSIVYPSYFPVFPSVFSAPSLHPLTKNKSTTAGLKSDFRPRSLPLPASRRPSPSPRCAATRRVCAAPACPRPRGVLLIGKHMGLGNHTARDVRECTSKDL